jgi:hypothetical protein
MPTLPESAGYRLKRSDGHADERNTSFVGQEGPMSKRHPKEEPVEPAELPLDLDDLMKAYGTPPGELPARLRAIQALREAVLAKN